MTCFKFRKCPYRILLSESRYLISIFIGNAQIAGDFSCHVTNIMLYLNFKKCPYRTVGSSDP